MAAVSLSMQGAPCAMNESMIFSLLDQSWCSRSVLSNSLVSAPSRVRRTASSTVGLQTEASFRSSDDGARLQYSVEASEMRTVFNFFDENADGLISGEELRRWYTKCSGKDVSDAAVESMISCVDRNNDGSVDFEEFLSLYKTHFSAVEEKEDDKSKRGFHIEEEDEADLLLEAFRVFDRNHDGLISAEELQAVLINLGMPEGNNLMSCEKMIRKVDRNGDGQCDIREFQEMMSTYT